MRKYADFTLYIGARSRLTAGGAQCLSASIFKLVLSKSDSERTKSKSVSVSVSKIRGQIGFAGADGASKSVSGADGASKSV